jgi:hypothetical protein
MLPIDPADDPGSVPPAQPLRDIVPLQAIAHGGTIIRPGAVAWGGMREATDGGYSSCEVIERALAAVVRNPAQLPGLLAELAASRLWVPLPARGRPFTDGAAVRLPLLRYQGVDYVPGFTSVQRLTTWTTAGADMAIRAGDARVPQADSRVIPHIVLPALGLARHLPAGLGLAINPDSVPGLPLPPESVPYLARLTPPAIVAASADLSRRGLAMQHLMTATGVRFLIGRPPSEPATLLAQARAALAPVLAVRRAARAWLSVPGRGEGLVISLILDDPGSEPARSAAAEAIERALAAAPLYAPFPVDVTFPGGTDPEAAYLPRRPAEPLDPVGAWIERNTTPFYTRD